MQKANSVIRSFLKTNQEPQTLLGSTTTMLSTFRQGTLSLSFRGSECSNHFKIISDKSLGLTFTYLEDTTKTINRLNVSKED